MCPEYFTIKKKKDSNTHNSKIDVRVIFFVLFCIPIYYVGSFPKINFFKRNFNENKFTY